MESKDFVWVFALFCLTIIAIVAITYKESEVVSKVLDVFGSSLKDGVTLEDHTQERQNTLPSANGILDDNNP